MVVELWQFEKRRNSTKIPDVSGIILNDVKLKTGATLHEPSFILTYNDFPTFNYVKAFGNYYFVNSTTLITNSVYRIDCVIDVLATYKAEILNTTAYIARASNAYNTSIDDIYIIPTAQQTAEFTSKRFPYISASGTYCLQVISSDGGTSIGGFANTYLLGAGNMAQLAQVLTNRDFVASVQDAIQNPLSTIVSLKWIPLTIGTDIGSGSLVPDILIGGQSTGVSGSLLGGAYSKQTSVTFSLTNSNEDFSFLNGDKYVSYDLFIPAVGMAHISGQDLNSSTDLTVELDFSVDGDIIAYIIRNGAGSFLNILGTMRANVAHNIPIAMTSNPFATSSIATIAGGAIGAIGGGFSGNAPLAISGVGAVATGIGQAMFGSTTTQKGGYDGARNVFTMYDSIILRKNKFAPSESISNINSTLGRPLARIRKVQGLTGYVQTQAFSISCNAELSEIQEINMLMNGGVYIE